MAPFKYYQNTGTTSTLAYEAKLDEQPLMALMWGIIHTNLCDIEAMAT
ncbi:MAG: hypothetical protein H0A76_05635 [Candidatus Thiodubiliella endoseptemdiera]|uniref:Uncharacterized protein n=1 Tax=Candidatus Thiodubiliella endoseptemdiera TaxID=2738886 RepID=A0A853F4A2_9GAMM|nr:hypothetical protein [Candidatus Thiodubiliella endoseptemdiera]